MHHYLMCPKCLKSRNSFFLDCPYCSEISIDDTKNETPILEENNTIFTRIRKELKKIFTRKIKAIKKTKPTDVINIACTIVIMFTGIFAYYVYKNQLQVMQGQLNQSEKSIEHSIESSRLDQRAWLGPVDIKIKEIKANSDVNIIVIIENSGKTPAFKKTAIFNIKFYKKIMILFLAMMD